MNPLSAILEVGNTLIERLIPSRQAKDEAKRKMMELIQKGEFRQLEERMSTIRAEATSSDQWTSRARPTFMYVVYLVVLVNCILMPAVGIFWPTSMESYFVYIAQGFDAIPGEVWATFTAGYLGYAGLRTYEKKKGLTN